MICKCEFLARTSTARRAQEAGRGRLDEED